MAKCANCGYERPPQAERAERFAQQLHRSNPFDYPIDEARKRGEAYAAAPGQNCESCGVPFVAAAE